MMNRVQFFFQSLDPRWFQITFLCSFLCVGWWARDFSLRAGQVGATLSAAFLTQAAWLYALKLPYRRAIGGYLSAIISALGISILVRSQNDWAHPLLAALAMSSKFIVRTGVAHLRSHVFNPANLAAFGAWFFAAQLGTWLSPAQWGSHGLLALWFLCLGGLVTGRIGRWDISLSFLFAWGSVLAGRLYWYDYTWNPAAAMWLQQMSNGAVLLFAFFMISDPMTTPQSRGGRVLYAALVAIAAFVWQWGLYRPHGLIVALAALSVTVPLFNWCVRARVAQRFAWRAISRG